MRGWMDEYCVGWVIALFKCFWLYYFEEPWEEDEEEGKKKKKAMG